MTKKQKRDNYYMKVAELTATNSYARRTKVGAVLVRDGRIISSGWNGQPAGLPNNCEDELPDGSLVTKNTVIHSEVNAIFFGAKNGIKTDGSTLYLTLSPCVTCALAIIQAGIKEVYYREKYRDLNGVKFLKKNNIKVYQLKETKANE